jgi:hypothetical protein
MKSETSKKATPIHGFSLTKMSDLRAFMSKIVNQAYRDEMTELRLKSLTYAISILARIIQESDFEQRLTELEEYVHGKRAA